MKFRSFFYTLIFLAITVFFISCESGSSVQQNEKRIAHVDSSLNALYDMFNRAGLTMGQPDVIMNIFILKQHFNLNFPFPTIPDFYEKRPYLQDRYFKLYNVPFDGKFDVNYTQEEVGAYLNESLNTDINALTFWSMYCDKFPLDERFLSTMKEKLNDPPVYPNLTDKNVPPPEYWPLHAALQIQGAINAGCIENTKEVDQLLSTVIEKVVSIAHGEIETTQYDQDIQTEAIAMLYYLGEDEKVSNYLIDQLLNNQLYGGGWCYNSTSESVSLHTSMLAMWVLLEHKEHLTTIKVN